MNKRHLFLFGGSPPFSNNLGKMFAKFSSNGEGKVALLFLERAGWQKYMKNYTFVLEENGLKDFVYLPLIPQFEKEHLKELISCTGIIICGGETELYRSNIVDTLIGNYIRKLYNKGIPIAGFSAGALVIPSNCVIPPIDNPQNKHLFLKGLGLLGDCVISVHFTRWNEENNLKTALTKVNASIGYGVDDGAGLYFENENLTETEGNLFLINPER